MLLHIFHQVSDDGQEITITFEEGFTNPVIALYVSALECDHRIASVERTGGHTLQVKVAPGTRSPMKGCLMANDFVRMFIRTRGHGLAVVPQAPPTTRAA
jgi:hypothetical protein